MNTYLLPTSEAPDWCDADEINSWYVDELPSNAKAFMQLCYEKGMVSPIPTFCFLFNIEGSGESDHFLFIH